ncbi:MAG: prenyltransferase [Coriobacteriales bacterium]|jgi:1,4-dihydroxy-2-naphthoate octaprenyltransferase|nr:prenyltransferase [Coriobacteriales bacterium]
MSFALSRSRRFFAGQSLGYWWQASRPVALGQSLSPYLLGLVVGFASLLYQGSLLSEGPRGLACALLGFAGVALAHSGLNLFDDYFDSRLGAVAKRAQMQDGGFCARMGKCGYLGQVGAEQVGLRDLRRISAFMVVCALLLGAAVFCLRGWPVLVFCGIALVLGFFYAAPPLRLSYHGLGELIVGLIFGPVIVLAATFISCGQVSTLAVFVSIPVGLLVSNILCAHAVMDFGPDQAAKRSTFVVLLGSPRRGYYACLVMLILVYADLLAGVAFGYLPLCALLVLLTLPLAITFLGQLRSYVNGQDKPFTPKPWLGSFGNWTNIQASGIAWFMAKWLLARNLCMQVSLLLALASLTPWYL